MTKNIVQTFRGTSLAVALITYSLLLTPFTSFSQCNYGWMKKLGHSSGEEWIGKSSTVDKNGNIYIAGGFAGITQFDGVILTSNGDKDMFIAKFDGDLNVIWAKSFGGEDLDALTDIEVDDVGNVYVVGDLFSSVIGISIPELGQTFKSKGGVDMFFAKLDSNGNFLWAKSYGDTQYDFIRDIAVDANQNVFITGDFRNDQVFDTINMVSNNAGGSSAAYDNFFLAKFDADGNIQWAKQSVNTSTTNGQLWGLSVKIGASGNLYLRTSLYNGVDTTFLDGQPIYNGGMCVIKYSNDGDFQWIRNPKHNDVSIYPRAIALDNNENVILCGHSKSGSGDVFVLGTDTIQKAEGFYIIKMDSAGNYLWARNSDGKTDNTNGGVYPYGIDTDEENNIYINGTFYISILFNGTAFLSYSQDVEFPALDVFYCKFDSLGESVWLKQVSSYDYQNTITYSLNYYDGSIISPGLYRRSCIFNNNEELILGAQGSLDQDYNIFVLNMNTDGNLIVSDFAGEDKAIVRCDSIEIGGVDYTNFLYDWTSQDNISSPTAYKTFVAPASNTDYILALTDNSTACKYIDTVTVSVDEPNYGMAFVADNRIHTAAPATVVFTNNTSNPGNYDFVWLFGDGESSTDSDPIYTYTTGGKMDVSLIAIEKSSSCADTLTYPEFIHIPVGIKEATSSLFSISPNPSNGEFTIEIGSFVERSRNAETIIEIFTIDGKMVYNEYINVETRHASSKQISTDLNKGMYFIKISRGEKSFAITKKIIIN